MPYQTKVPRTPALPHVPGHPAGRAARLRPCAGHGRPLTAAPRLPGHAATGGRAGTDINGHREPRGHSGRDTRTIHLPRAAALKAPLLSAFGYRAILRHTPPPLTDTSTRTHTPKAHFSPHPVKQPFIEISSFLPIKDKNLQSLQVSLHNMKTSAKHLTGCVPATPLNHHNYTHHVNISFLSGNKSRACTRHR